MNDWEKKHRTHRGRKGRVSGVTEECVLSVKPFLLQLLRSTAGLLLNRSYIT